MLWGTVLLLAACKPAVEPADHVGSASSPGAERTPSAAVPLRVRAPGETATPLPAAPPRDLPPAALAARVQAQQAILGRTHLFEDDLGRPVPWLSDQAYAPEEELLEDALLDTLPGSSGLGGPAGAMVGTRVNGNALGLFEPLLSPSGGTELTAFYEALRALARGEDPDGKVRILLYGASHTDADVYPQYVRRYLQDRFGDGGHGFVHVAKPWRWYGHFDMEVDGFKYWRTDYAQRPDAREDGMFGLLGASLAASNKKAFGRVFHRNGTTGAIYELYYLQQPKGGSFRVLVDGAAVATVKTRAPQTGPGYHLLQLTEGSHAIEIQPVGNGEVRMFGMTVETSTPGVVVDTLGIGGTRAANLLSWNEPLWREHVQRRDPALVVLAYGTNEATDTDQSIEAYEHRLREVVARVQAAAPRASCLLVGPGDFPLPLGTGDFGPRPRLRQIIEIQKTIARDTGCAFWDALAFMGGDLSMVQWVNAIPQMAKGDHIHLTRRGYVRMGMALVDAMMESFDDAPTTASALPGSP